MKKHSLKSIALSLALTMSAALPVNAMTTDEIIGAWSDVVPLSVDTIDGNNLKIDGTDGQTSQEIAEKTWALIASTGVIKGYDFQTYQYDVDCKYAITTPEDAENALTKYTYCKDWLVNNMPIICPNGTSMNEVIPRCIDWICKNLSYDFDAAQNGGAVNYQSAYSAFNGSGLGVCATYSCAFVSMVSFVPIETGTSYVNWDAENVWYFETGQYISATHQWSAVKNPVTGVWDQYDITNYDTNGLSKNLRMTDATLAGWNAYANPTFYPAISLREVTTK